MRMQCMTKDNYMCMQCFIGSIVRDVFCLRSIAAGTYMYICVYVCSVPFIVHGVCIRFLDQSQKENYICMQCFDVCRWRVTLVCFRSAAERRRIFVCSVSEYV